MCNFPQITEQLTLVLFGTGLITFLTGLGVMASQAFNRQQDQMADSTRRLAQKGMAEDVAVLVGNANQLLSTLNDINATRSGSGLVMMFVGGLLMIADLSIHYWALLQCGQAAQKAFQILFG